jgi:hypothetical protein
MKWYKCYDSEYKVLPDIREVEVSRETEHYVTINGVRKAKSSTWDCYFPTWDDAHAFLVERQTSIKNSTFNGYCESVYALVKIKNMKKN